MSRKQGERVVQLDYRYLRSFDDDEAAPSWLRCSYSPGYNLIWT